MTGTLPVRAMTPDELRSLMAFNRYDNASQLAERIGVHRNTVARWLKGNRRIDRAHTALLLTVLKKPKH